MNNQTIQYQLGLIGYPLSHSFSKRYFSEKFDQEHLTGYHYELFPLENIQALPSLLKNTSNLLGLNVTIPYKQEVIRYLDECSDEARTIGAVNTIKIINHRLYGFNTDVYGFEQSLRPLLQPHHQGALILGTGGAAKAVAYVLQKLQIYYTFVSRTPNEAQLSYQSINQQVLSDYTIIINATPLGTFPNIDRCPDLPYGLLNNRHLLYDLVYNPTETLFLKRGKLRSTSTKNGLEMLHLQADKAWKIWTNPTL